MDAVSRVDDAVALAAYVQALVCRYAAADERGESLPAHHPVIAQENKWRAARYGLQATLVDVERGGPAPVIELIGRTLATLEPYARELGSEHELEGIRRILRDGNGAQRQLRAHIGADAQAVARAIADATQSW